MGEITETEWRASIIIIHPRIHLSSQNESVRVVRQLITTIRTGLRP